MCMFVMPSAFECTWQYSSAVSGNSFNHTTTPGNYFPNVAVLVAATETLATSPKTLKKATSLVVTLMTATVTTLCETFTSALTTSMLTLSAAMSTLPSLSTSQSASLSISLSTSPSLLSSSSSLPSSFMLSPASSISKIPAPSLTLTRTATTAAADLPASLKTRSSSNKTSKFPVSIHIKSPPTTSYRQSQLSLLHISIVSIFILLSCFPSVQSHDRHHRNNRINIGSVENSILNTDNKVMNNLNSSSSTVNSNLVYYSNSNNNIHHIHIPNKAQNNNLLLPSYTINEENIIIIEGSSKNRSVATTMSNQLLKNIMPEGPCALKNEFTFNENRIRAQLNQSGAVYDERKYPVDPEVRRVMKKCPDREVIKNHTIENFKANLLKKLNMKNPPNVKPGKLPDIPSLMALKSKVDQDKNFINTANKQSFFVFGVASPDEDGVVTFVMRRDYKLERVKTVWLNVYVKEPPKSPPDPKLLEATWLIISDGKTVLLRKKLDLYHSYQRYTNTWHKLDITQSVHTFFQTKYDPTQTSNNFTVSIVCGFNSKNLKMAIVKPIDSSEYDKMPYLFIRLHRMNVSRSKRELMTSEKTCDHDNYRNSRCCRYVLEINFNLMGWSWVIAPTVYQTFYCAGDCPEMNIYAFSGSRDNRMYSFVRRNEDASCCSATKHSDLSILYQNEKGDILHEVVPNMVLEQCGCS